MNEISNIGKNIKQARTGAGLTQRELSERSHISTTQLSAYENSKQLPGLTNLAVIANALNTSIDYLYYGDSSESFITSASSKGKAIANCIFNLWNQGVLCADFKTEYEDYARTIFYYGRLNVCCNETMRLLEFLNDFRGRIDNFDNPDDYLEQTLNSFAKEIDRNLNH